MKKRLIISLIVLLSIIILPMFNKMTLAMSIVKGKTAKIQLSDLTDNTGTPYKIKSYKVADKGIVEVTEKKTKVGLKKVTTSLTLKGVKKGKTTLTVNSVRKETRIIQNNAPQTVDVLMQKNITVTIKDAEDAGTDSMQLPIVKGDDSNYSKTLGFACPQLNVNDGKTCKVITDTGWAKVNDGTGGKQRAIHVVYKEGKKYKSATHDFACDNNTIAMGFMYHSVTVKDITEAEFKKKVKQNTQSDPTKDGDLMNDMEKIDNYNRKFNQKIKVVDGGGERGTTNFNDVLSDVNTYDPGEITETGGIENIGSKILGGINIIGIVASVIILAVLGLKFILGTLEEKSEIKESLPQYLIGVVLLVGITTIVNILYNFGQSLK